MTLRWIHVTIRRRHGALEEAEVLYRGDLPPLLQLAGAGLCAQAACTLGIVVVDAEPEVAEALRREGYWVELDSGREEP